MPKVSVIIPTYNYGKYIEKAIDSVLAQTYKDFEIIVVDDGSTDNTREIIETKYKDKVRYFYQENSGAPVARNKGIKESKGEYLVFLDADDWFMPENLEKKVAFLDNNAGYGWVYSDGYYVNKEGEIIDKASNRFSFSNRKLEGNISFELFSMGNYIAMDSVLMRKECINEVGPFNETLPAYHDYELWLRLSLKFKIKILNDCLTYQVVHSGSLSSQDCVYPRSFLMITQIHKSLFIKKIGRTKWRRLRSDRYNLLGLYFLKTGKLKMARKAFFSSIASFPFQKSVYKYLTTSFKRCCKVFYTKIG